MNLKSLSILGLITLGMVGGAVLVLQQQRAAVQPDSAQQPMYPRLMTEINAVTGVVVKHKADTITLAWQADERRWVVNERAGYPANPEQVQHLLIGLTTAQILEAKTRKPEYYAKLGLADVSADAESTQVTLQDKSGQTLIDVLIGKTRPGNAPALYLRNVGDAQAWLVKGEAPAAGAVPAWLQRRIMDVAEKRVKQVSIQHPDGSLVTMSKTKAEDEHFVLSSLPSGAKIKSDYVVDQLAGVLQGLELEDVKPAAEANLGDVVTISQYQTFDGVTVTVRTAEVAGSRYGQFELAFVQPPVEPEAPPKTDSPSPNNPESKPAETSKPDYAAIAKEAQERNTALKPWVFQLAEAQWALLRKPMAELLDTTPAVEPAATSQAPSPADVKAVLADPLANLPAASAVSGNTPAESPVEPAAPAIAVETVPAVTPTPPAETAPATPAQP